MSELKNNKEHIFHVVLSNAISKQIDYESYPKNFKFFLYSLKPTVLKTLIGHDSFLDQLERSIKPNCVFTVFGPSYWIPKTNHVMGYAIPHYIYPESPFFKIISLKDKIIRNILKALHKINLKFANSYFFVETEDVRHRLSYFLSIDIQRIFTISNTYHSVFDNYLMSNENNQSSLGLLPYTNVFRFITISAFYPHKNLAILKKVIPSIRESWGLVVHEAVSSGYALILSSAVGSKEDLATSKNSIIFKPKNENEIYNALKKAANWSDLQYLEAQKESLFISKKFGPNQFSSSLNELIMLES